MTDDDTSNMPAAADSPQPVHDDAPAPEGEVPASEAEPEAEGVKLVEAPTVEPPCAPKVEIVELAPKVQENLIALMGVVVTALEHVAGDRPGSAYLRQLVGAMRQKIDALQNG